MHTRAKAHEEQVQFLRLSHASISRTPRHRSPQRARAVDNLSAHVQVAIVVIESIQTEATPEYAKAKVPSVMTEDGMLTETSMGVYAKAYEAIVWPP